MITVLVVDDYPVMRQLLRDILERYPNVHIVGEAADGEEAILRSNTLKPAVVIIDVHLPTMSAMEAVTVIKRECPWTTIIGLTAAAQDEAESGMRDAGAAAVLSKGDLVNTLYPAIVVATKSAYASASVIPNT